MTDVLAFLKRSLKEKDQKKWVDTLLKRERNWE